MSVSFPHFGICVEDVQRSAAFYVNALGFEVAIPEARATGLGTLLGLPGAEAKTLFIQHPAGGRIELYSVEPHGAVGGREPAAANRRGLSHLCIVVDDLEARMSLVRNWGGVVLEDTMTENAYGRLVFCADPDGVRLELVGATPSGA